MSDVLGKAAVLFLTAGLASIAVAGPGSNYWRERDRAIGAAKKPDAAAPAAARAMTCPDCKTTKLEAAAPSGGSKPPASATVIGGRHMCQACGGEIVTVRGKTTNTMKYNCPICAKAKAAGTPCCVVTP